MKKFCLLFVFVFGLFLTSLNVYGEDGDILLSGDLPSVIRDRSFPQSIQAFLETGVLQIELPAHLGTINMTVDDEYGNTVYQQSISTTTAQTVVINLAFWSNGEYTLLLVNAQGKYLQGEFEIE